MAQETRKIKVRSFETAKDLASCLLFSEGYAQILTDQNINSSYINSYEWVTNRGIHGILAECDGKIVGGLLLFRPNSKKSIFPFEEIIENAVSNAPFTLNTSDKNYAEIFAIWNSKSAAGWGLSYVLLKAGFALSVRLGFDKTFYLVADYNLRLAEKLGLEPVQSQGYDMCYSLETKPFKVRICLFYFSTRKISYSRKEMESILEIARQGISTQKEKGLSSIFEIEYHID